MRRGQKRQGKYSLSCTEEDWERIKARASHAGMSVSAFIVQSALALDPSRPRMDFGFAREQHQVITEAAQRMMTYLSPEPSERSTSLLSTLHGRVTFLVRMAMDDMLDRGCRDDLEHRLDLQFGTGEGRRMVNDYLERKGRGAVPE